MIRVKICGNRTPEDVLAAAEAGADFVGMVFARSKRQVNAQQANAMVRALGEPLAAHPLMVPPPAQPHVREESRAWFRHGSHLLETYLESKRPLTVGVFADQSIGARVVPQVQVDPEVGGHRHPLTAGRPVSEGGR